MLGAPGDRLPDPTAHQRFQKNLEVPSNLVGWISNALALYTKLDLVRLSAGRFVSASPPSL